MSEETERYRGDDPSMINAIGLDMSEELQYVKFSHNHRQDSFGQRNNQASGNSEDVVEWSRVHHNAWFVLGKFHRAYHVRSCGKRSVGELVWSTSINDPMGDDKVIHTSTPFGSPLVPEE